MRLSCTIKDSDCMFFILKIQKVVKCCFDTEISENMLNLSGGEVQKLAMVRLFCENKPIYILDEPTGHTSNKIVISFYRFC